MDTIIRMIEDWSHAKDEQLSTNAILFDFAKAFDLVDYRVLPEKLSKMLPEISLLAAYLTEWQQRAKVEESTTTKWKKVVAGVIHESVFGPVLFLLR